MISEASVPVLVDAIMTSHLVQLTYIDMKGQMTTRIVEPYELRSDGHFFAYDVAKDGIRDFRIDGIQEPIVVMDETFTPRWEPKVG